MGNGLWAVALLCAFAVNAHAARRFEPIDIPGAKCADGSQYQVMLSQGDPKRVAFDLMGGGACWNFSTCFGPTPLAWIHRIPVVFEKNAFVSDSPEESPVAGDTLVFFPYCTGDVHVGDHVATYALGAKIHHWGKRNFELAVEYLQSTGLVDLRAANRFVLFGYSAGAIGALFHAFTVEPYLEHAREKILLADSPGLHFGERFWEKFSPEFLHDFNQGFERAGVSLDRSHGNIAALVPALCRKYPDWRVGVLQGSRDVIMSRLFGDISGADHERLIYGPEGLYSLTLESHDNCAAWVPSTAMHTFLFAGATAGLQASDGVSAMDFAFETVGPGPQPNHR